MLGADLPMSPLLMSGWNHPRARHLPGTVLSLLPDNLLQGPPPPPRCMGIPGQWWCTHFGYCSHCSSTATWRVPIFPCCHMGGPDARTPPVLGYPSFFVLLQCLDLPFHPQIVSCSISPRRHRIPGDWSGSGDTSKGPWGGGAAPLARPMADIAASPHTLLPASAACAAPPGSGQGSNAPAWSTLPQGSLHMAVPMGPIQLVPFWALSGPCGPWWRLSEWPGNVTGRLHLIMPPAPRAWWGSK